MSLDSTGNLKQQLVTHLGPKAPIYFDSLQAFVSGKISRGEFEDGVKQVLTSSALLQVHNALIISLFDATAAYKRSAAAAAVQSQEQTATPPPTTATKPPPRKRRRTLLPYQGPGVSEDARSLRSMRLKRWVLAMGRKERERVKALYRVTIGPTPPPATPPVPNQGAPMVVDGQPQPPMPIIAQPQQPMPPAAPGRLHPPVDEIQSERGVMLLPERSGLPGGRPPIQLHSSTRAPTVQHIADRINLTCAQHNLAMPSRSVAALMSLACESKLKQLITHAITLTLSSQAISSITPTTPFNSANPFVSMIASSSSQIDASSSIGGNAHNQTSLPSLASSSTLHHIPQRTPVLTTAAFQSLFTLYPASLPNNSASAMRLSAIPTAMDDETDDLPVLKDREVRDQRWQIMALLAERSAVKEALKSVSLCSLFREISCVKPRRAKQAQAKPKQNESPALQIFKRWLVTLCDKFGPPSGRLTAAILRLMFPEEDAKRRYMMQEARLIQRLAQCYGVNPRKFTQWDRLEGSGCLGDDVRVVLEQSNSRDSEFIGPLSILQVDGLLTELASHCPFSDKSIRNQKSPRTQTDIIGDLYRDMSPEDASYLTQIILRDLRPLLYPLAETDSTAALTHYNTRAVTKLSKVEVMRAWDPSILRAYRVQADFDRAAEGLAFEPEFGVVIDVPKSQKGQGCRHSLDFLRSSRRVWAENKYDGERAQIHVMGREIKIFSKSKRDSTLDRKGIHDVIFQALGDNFTGSAILDAEMVAFDGDRVDEFWRIRHLIDSTAQGIRHKWAKPRHEDSQASLASNDSDTRRLGLVFFDVLMFKSKSLLSTPYSERRRILEDIIRPTRGRAILSKRFPIDMLVSDPERALTRIFAEHVADFQEGLVIKAEESRYNDYKLPWVKFKRDYIPGYGDTVDLVLIGASWEKERARELRVGPKTLTTFYFGAIDKNRPVQKPHIEVIFTASYGLTREQLERLNLLIRSSNTLDYPISQKQTLDYYSFNLYSGLSAPSLMLEHPLLVELYGAGFTKSPQCQYYELRWPRMTKVFRSNERDWKEGMDLQTLQDIAYASVGREKSDKDIDDCVRAMFGKSVDLGIKCPKRRERVVEEWEEKLCSMDGRKQARRKEKAVASAAGASERPAPKRQLADDGGYEPKAPPGAISCPARSFMSPVKRQKVNREEIQETDGVEWYTAADKKSSKKSPLGVVTNIVPTEPSPSTPAFKTPPPPSQRTENDENIGTEIVLPAFTAGTGQLPTPSTSPVRPPAPTSLTPNGAVPSEVVTKVKHHLGHILQDAHVAFVRFGGSKTKCTTCSRLRKLVSGDRRVHVVESLLSACGWALPGVMGAYVERGVIVVEGVGSEDGVEELLNRLRALERDDKSERKRITIAICDGPTYEFR